MQHEPPLPFQCSVVVRPTDFESLHPEHAELAVRTDLAPMGGTGIPAPDPDSLLQADYQLSSWSNSIRRQGSGRAGVYRGHYLKGVGRTPLAGNWDSAEDWYHASGHMFPSSAVREYLTTVYMQARGLGDRIVPCTGLLLAPLAADLSDAMSKALGQNHDRLAPIDRALTAISVKPAGFARASNFLWLCSRMSGWGEQWAEFVPTMERFCSADGSLERPIEDCSAETLASALRTAMKRSLEGLARDFAAGVQWNSMWNNFTLDGRMLDLEVATLACRPMLGAVTPFGFGTGNEEPEPPRRLSGLEVIDHAHELRMNALGFANGASNLLAMPLLFDEAEGRFMEEWAERMRALAGDAELFDRDALVGRAVDGIEGHGEASRERLLQEAHAYAEERSVAWMEPALNHVTLAKTPVQFARVEPAVSQALWLEPAGYRAEDWSDVGELEDLFASIYRCTESDRALSAVLAAADAIRGRWAA